MLTALTGMVHLLFPEMMMIMRSQYLISFTRWCVARLAGKCSSS